MMTLLGVQQEGDERMSAAGCGRLIVACVKAIQQPAQVLLRVRHEVQVVRTVKL
jgi:hypothetical protein